MTDTIANSPERARRASGYWDSHPELSEPEVYAIIDQELRDEAEAAAERAAYGKSMSDSLDSMWRCAVCGQNAVNTGLCPDCLRTEAIIAAERSAAIPVPGGGDRRAAVEAWMGRLGR